MLTVERLVAEVGLALASGAESGATEVRSVHGEFWLALRGRELSR